MIPARSSPPRQPDDLAPGALIGGRFRVVAPIADGGLATVVRAEDPEARDRSPAAIKVMHALHAGLPEPHRRFAREEEASRRVGRAIGAALRTAGVIGRRPWLAFDLVEGESMAQRIARAPLSPPEAARMVGEALERLRTLHTAGLVHRDVKPGNLLVAVVGGVRLLDLGCAASVGAPPALQDGPLGAATAGTAAYAAPEQSEGASADPTADIYSTGVVLFEAVTGRRPFVGDPIALVAAHARMSPPRPRTIVPSLSAELEAVVLAALAKDPDRRFSSAQAMRVALLDTPEARAPRLSPNFGEPR